MPVRSHPTPSRPARRHPLRSGVAVIVLAVAASGCGAPDRAGADELDEVTADLAAFERSGDRDALVRRREDAVAGCMEAVFGLPYAPLPPDGPPPPEEPRDTYGLVDQFTGRAGPAPATGSTDPNEALVATLSPAEADAWRLAAFGSDRGYRDANPGSTDARRVGCVNAASAVVLGPRNAQVLAEIAEANQQIAADTDQDPELARAVARHAECVAEAGFATPGAESFDPATALLAEARRRIPALVDQPIEAVVDQLGPDAPVVDELRDHERAMHRADRRCATELDLEAVREAARTRAADRYATSHANRLEHYRTVLDDVRRRAAAATTDPGGWDAATFADGGEVGS